MDDKDIIQLYWDRNEHAIDETAAKYGNYCKSIAVNILKNTEDAEECVNDAYLNAWNAIPPHRPELFSAFLGKIVRNLSFNKLKYNHTKKRGGYEIDLILDELAELVSGTESAEDVAMKHELVHTVNAFLDTLSTEKRSLFVRRYWYSDNIPDIAKTHGRSETSVSVELGRIRKKLHIYLTERGYHL